MAKGKIHKGETVSSATEAREPMGELITSEQLPLWIPGELTADIPGKTNTAYFYMAGLGAYRHQLSEVRNQGYQGFKLQ